MAPSTRATSVGLASVIITAGLLAAGCANHETGGTGKAAAATVSATVSASAKQNLKPHGVDEAGKSSRQILADTRRVALAARSVHLVGNVGSGVTLDLVLTNSGRAKGTLTQSGQVQKIVVLDTTTVYAATSKTGGRYVRLPQANAAQVSKSFNMTRLMADALTPDGTAVKAGVTSKDGTQQIGLKDTSDGSILYVADSAGAPYPLRITHSGQEGVVFSDWNKTVTVQLPGSST